MYVCVHTTQNNFLFKLIGNFHTTTTTPFSVHVGVCVSIEQKKNILTTWGEKYPKKIPTGPPFLKIRVLQTQFFSWNWLQSVNRWRKITKWENSQVKKLRITTRPTFIHSKWRKFRYKKWKIKIESVIFR